MGMLSPSMIILWLPDVCMWCCHSPSHQIGDTVILFHVFHSLICHVASVVRSPKFNSNQYFTEHLLWAKHCAAVSTKVNEIHIVLTKGGKQGKGWACRDGGGMNWEIGIDVYTLIYVKYITNKNLLCNK